jgi:peroxiredoxin
MRSFARIIGIVRKIPILLLVALCSLTAADFGPPTGSRFPAFSLPDQSGKLHSSRSLLGPKGAVILFYQSADWCSYCKAQIKELEQHQEAFHKLGLGIAAVSHDSPAVLKDFAGRAGIHFPLLSDSNSKAIRALRILNEEAAHGSPQYGAAHPGWFVLDAKGVITAKYFEDDASQSYTSAAILVHQFGWAPPETPRKVEGKQLTATIGASNSRVAPGQRVALTVDIDLQENLHVYAPGVDNYIPIEWKIEDSDTAQAHPPVFPHAEKLFLKAINETVPTYTNHFRLIRDITIPPEEKLKAKVDGSGHFTVDSVLNYQACDDRMCYFPQKVRLQWTFEYEALDKPRVSAELQRRQPEP